jgi:hypothetical protein
MDVAVTRFRRYLLGADGTCSQSVSNRALKMLEFNVIALPILLLYFIYYFENNTPNYYYYFLRCFVLNLLV